MRLRSTERFLRSFTAAPSHIQKAYLKQADLLLLNLRHPSLHAKKYSEAENIWQARINRAWRFYFTIIGDEYVLITMMRHPK